MHSFLNKKLVASILTGATLVGAINPAFALNTDSKSNSLNKESSTEDSLGDSSNTEDTGGNDSGTETNPDDNNTNIETKLTLVSDINKNNIDKECTVTAKVNSLNKNIVNVTDSSGSGDLYLEFTLDTSLKEGDTITAKGTIKYLNEQAYLFVASNNDLTVQENSNNNSNNDSNTNPDNNNSNQNSNSNQKPSGTDGNKAPTMSQGGMTTNQTVSNNQSTDVVSTTPSVYSRSYNYINYDLSSSQWEKVKDALEDKLIKVRDLNNNQIMIKKTSNGYGDRVWIVNDPRELDIEEEETTRTIGTDLTKDINYNDYGIKESTWNTIVTNVENGNAKLKITKDGNIKVIYSKSNKKDTITILEKQ